MAADRSTATRGELVNRLDAALCGVRKQGGIYVNPQLLKDCREALQSESAEKMERDYCEACGYTDSHDPNCPRPKEPSSPSAEPATYPDANYYKAERDELRRFHDACIKELYRMLGVDGSDGEYRFKWAALALSGKLRELEKLKSPMNVPPATKEV